MVWHVRHVPISLILANKTNVSEHRDQSSGDQCINLVTFAQHRAGALPMSFDFDNNPNTLGKIQDPAQLRSYINFQICTTRSHMQPSATRLNISLTSGHPRGCCGFASLTYSIDDFIFIGSHAGVNDSGQLRSFC